MDKNKNITTQKNENIDSKSKKEDKEKELEKEEPVIILQAQTLQEKLYYLRSSYDLARAGVTMPTEFLNKIYEDLLKVLVSYENIITTSNNEMRFHKEFDKIEIEIMDKLEVLNNAVNENYVADMTTEGNLGVFDKDDKIVRVYNNIDDYRINIEEDIKTNFRRDKYFDNIKTLDLNDKSKNTDD